jgi:glutamate-1-semialdehyde 2,1-aminomutase
MNYARRPGIDSVALQRLTERENESFLTTHRESARLAEASAAHWLNGVPMHWMRDWNTPHPLFVRRARGVEVEDVDGNSYIDFCFGDTGAMFGHAPAPIARALAAAGAEGITAMLPAERVARVGEKLANLFGLPFWQMTQTASDANRAVLALGARGHRACAHPVFRWLLSRHGRRHDGARGARHEGQGWHARSRRLDRREP